MWYIYHYLLSFTIFSEKDHKLPLVAMPIVLPSVGGVCTPSVLT